MKITKHSKKNNKCIEKYNVTCKCGCEFIAEASEAVLVERAMEKPKLAFTCPECGSSIKIERFGLNMVYFKAGDYELEPGDDGLPQTRSIDPGFYKEIELPDISIPNLGEPETGIKYTKRANSCSECPFYMCSYIGESPCATCTNCSSLTAAEASKNFTNDNSKIISPVE